MCVCLCGHATWIPAFQSDKDVVGSGKSGAKRAGGADEMKIEVEKKE